MFFFNKYKQFIGLSVVQGGNALFPLLAFPIILAAVGDEKFAQVVFSESVVMIFLALIIYSFDVTGVKDIQKSASDGEQSRVFFNILWLRLLICLCIYITVFVLYALIGNAIFINIAIWMLLPVGYAIQSNYFYLAKENNQLLGVFVLFSRLISLLIIFLFVNSASEVQTIIFFLSSSFLLSGLISLTYCCMYTLNGFSFISKDESIKMIKEGFPILISNLSVGFFRGSNILLLGILSSSSAVTVYSMAEKLIKAVQAIMNPLNQLGLVKFSGQYQKNMKDSIRNLIWCCTKNQFFISLFLVFIVSITFIVVASYIDDSDIDNVLTIFLLMSPSILFGVLNYMYGMVGMNVVGLTKQFSYSVMLTGFVTASFAAITIPYFGQVSAAVSYFSGEFLLFCFVYFSILKRSSH